MGNWMATVVYGSVRVVWALEVKRQYYQNSSVPDCVTMFTVSTTLI